MSSKGYNKRNFLEVSLGWYNGTNSVLLKSNGLDLVKDRMRRVCSLSLSSFLYPLLSNTCYISFSA